MNVGKSLACLAVAAVAAGSIAAPAFAVIFTSQKGYTLTTPAGWSINTSGVMGSDVFIFAKPVNKFAPNVNAMVTPAMPGDTLDSGVAQIKTLFPRMFTGYQSIYLRRGKIGGLPAVLNTGVYTSGVNRLRMRQALVLHGGMEYTFTCTAPENMHAKYDPQFTNLLASIRWK